MYTKTPYMKDRIRLHFQEEDKGKSIINSAILNMLFWKWKWKRYISVVVFEMGRWKTSRRWMLQWNISDWPERCDLSEALRVPTHI